ncbi:MAG: C25 family cysteine peptidase, partial [Longimicrobiales bacterium]
MALLGYLQDDIDPDHHVTVSLNGTEVGDVWWDGITWEMLEMDVPAGLLAAGDNTLQVVCPNDTGVGHDMVYVDWIELVFANTFLAEADELAFSYDTDGTRFQVDGFSSGPLVVYDVTDPAAPVRIDGVDVVGSGPYSALFQDDVTAATDYFALAETAYRTVQAIEPDTPSNLQSTANAADHIVIAHSDFSAQAGALRDHRASQGLRAVAVDVQDVYDEFGYGVEGAAAIHDFLAYAYASWRAPAPSYVVLVGDGHYDPKDYGGYGRVSYIPPYLGPVDSTLGETAADNRYVTLVGDDVVPDMMLGRLAVNTAAEASAFVDKIVAYEQAPPGDWQQQVLAVADNADGAGDFAAMSDALLGG